MAIWRIPPSPPQPRPRVVQASTVTTDDPPFSSTLRKAAALAVVVAAWQPRPPQPWQGYALNPALSAVAEEAPPPSQRRRSTLAAIRQSWEVRIEPQQRRLIVVHATAENPANDRTARAVQSVILRSWQPGPLPQQRQRTTPITSAVVADDPPFAVERATQRLIVQAWQWRYANQPPRAPFLREDQPPLVNDPPFGVPLPSLGIILRAWKPWDRLPTRRYSPFTPIIPAFAHRPLGGVARLTPAVGGQPHVVTTVDGTPQLFAAVGGRTNTRPGF